MNEILKILSKRNNVVTWLNPVSGAWHLIYINQFTHQDWKFTEDSWSCIRFNAKRPYFIYRQDGSFIMVGDNVNPLMDNPNMFGDRK